MNTPVLASELPPAERKRRKTIAAANERMFVLFGFKKVSHETGRWWHPMLHPGVVFDWSEPGRHVTTGDILESVFSEGRRVGKNDLRRSIKTLLNIRQD